MSTYAFLRRSQPVPVEYRSVFRHLYWDIAWYGVLSGSAIAFLTVYATRLGASPFMVGLLTAGPAVINLMFTLPTGRRLESRPIGPAVFWSSVFNRFFYLIWVVIPWLFLPQGQLWAFVLVTLLMSIPGTALSVGFNALFAEAVPTEWRGHVTGIRNAVLSVAFVAATLVSGQILARVAFPLNYQIVFAIGLLGAAMSSVHVYFVRPVGGHSEDPSSWRNLGDLASPGRLRGAVSGVRTSVGLRFLVSKQRVRSLLRFEILSGPFGIVLLGLFAFHLAQYLAIPLFPLVWVNDLNFSDDLISFSQALFYVAVFVGSTQLSRLVKRFGNQRVTAAGVLLLALYPAISAVMRGPFLFMVVSLLGGAAWSLVGGGIANYILDRTPHDDRPAHLAWYNLALNGAILLGALGGPLLADVVGITAALFIAAGARAISGVYIWRRG